MRQINLRSLVGLLVMLCVLSRLIGADNPPLQWQRIPFPDPRVQVCGLPWFDEDKPALRRLPARLKDTFRPVVWDLAQHTSGARIRFRTNSRHIGVTAKAADAGVMHHFTSVGQNGMDLYVDGNYQASAWPDGQGRIVTQWSASSDGKPHDITIYLALYKNIAIEELRLDPSATLESPSPFAVTKPVVYYGSSITQGGCATNAGLSCQAILGRWMNHDFVNLGMSGNGLGEPAMAQALAEIDSACIVLDYWANPSLKVYQQTLPPFVQIIRKKRPDVPILVVGPFYLPFERLGSPGSISDPEHKRRFARSFVESRKKAGDRHIFYVDGLEMISPEQSDGLVDGVHPNSLGFYYCAKGLRPHLERVLTRTLGAVPGD